jgi:hypothetical protein
VSPLLSPPRCISEVKVKCIGYNFDGSNVNGEDFSKLRYENGEEIKNVEYYLEKW